MAGGDRLPTPIEDRFFEDYPVGSVLEYGTILVDQDEVLAFAQRFDPQTMHIDPIAAADGPFKGLIASGWHTVSMMMRLYVDNYLSDVASLASPGVDELRWSKPVRPGDRLRIRVSILEAVPSRTKPDRGLLRSFVEALNQDGDVVASFRAMNLLMRRRRGGE